MQLADPDDDVSCPKCRWNSVLHLAPIYLDAESIARCNLCTTEIVKGLTTLPESPSDPH